MSAVRLAPRYSPVQHLAYAIWLNHDPRQRVMSFVAYYDTSGSQEDAGGTLTAVSVVSTVERWLTFETEWNAVLARYEVPCPKGYESPRLHMYDFAHKKQDFSGWKYNDDEAKRMQFIADLVEVLRRALLVAFAVQMRPDHFHMTRNYFRIGEQDQEYAPNPYSFLMYTCIAYAEEWLEIAFPDVSRKHFVEAGDDGQGPLRATADKYPRFRISVEPKYDEKAKRWLVPFQAADLIAYEYGKNLSVGLGGSGRPGKTRFAILRDSLPIAVRTHDYFNLCLMCERNPELFPPKFE